jgi:hypothetical protein
MISSRMIFNVAPLVFALILHVTPATTFADHFAVSLEVSDGKAKQAAGTESDPPKDPAVAPRPVFNAPADAQLAATWKITATGKEPLKDVLVHFYVVRIDRAGQSPPPLEPKDVVLESALTMDFEPKTGTGATLKFRVPQPGTYLVRIETQGGAEKKTHEHFAAIDVVVK